MSQDIATGTMANAPAVAILKSLSIPTYPGVPVHKVVFCDIRGTSSIPLGNRDQSPCAEPGAEQEVACLQDPSGAEGEIQGQVPVQASPSSSLNEAVLGTAMVPSQ